MFLNTIKPAKGSRKKPIRLGRGVGSGMGKTCGKGHKGQKARAGGYHKVGFEGGQMPLQRRLPKFGFTPLDKKEKTEITLRELNLIDADFIDLDYLKANKILSQKITQVKVIFTGKLTKAITIRGLKVTKSAREAILALGGKVE